MLKKTITFENYDGTTGTMDAYFNLTKTECVDLNLEFEDDGGLIGRIKKLMSDKIDGETIRKKPAVDFVKLLIERSYGERPSNNPSLFIKEDDNGKPLYRKFKQTAAYDALVYSLLTGEESLDKFIENILPQVDEQQKAEAKELLKKEGLEDLLNEVK